MNLEKNTIYRIKKPQTPERNNNILPIKNSKKQYHYVIKFIVYDDYDFNKNEKVKNIGNLLNNFGFLLQENGIGETFTWAILYTHYTDWVDVD